MLGDVVYDTLPRTSVKGPTESAEGSRADRAQGGPVSQRRRAIATAVMIAKVSRRIVADCRRARRKRATSRPSGARSAGCAPRWRRCRSRSRRRTTSSGCAMTSSARRLASHQSRRRPAPAPPAAPRRRDSRRRTDRRRPRRGPRPHRAARTKSAVRRSASATSGRAALVRRRHARAPQTAIVRPRAARSRDRQRELRVGLVDDVVARAPRERRHLVASRAGARRSGERPRRHAARPSRDQAAVASVG